MSRRITAIFTCFLLSLLACRRPEAGAQSGMVDSGTYRHNYRQSIHAIVLSVDRSGLPPGGAAAGWRSLRVRIIYSGPGPGPENPIPFLDLPAG